MNETLKRALSGLVYVLLLLFCTLYSHTSFIVLIGFFLLFATKEFCTMHNLPVVVPIILSSCIYVFFAVYSDYLQSPFFTSFLITLSIGISVWLIVWLFSDNIKVFNTRTLYLLVATYVLLSFLLLTKLPIITNEYYPAIIVSIFILIWVNDTFAYIVGKSIGKTKLLEHISPKKTVEGFIGGLLFSLLFSVIISKFYVTNFSVITWIIVSLLISIFGSIGDLIESKFKRIAQVKDSGTIMPGHGGMLDRLDSIIFASPFLFLFFKISSYVS